MNKWEKALQTHNQNFLQIPFKFFHFSKNDIVVILLAEILEEFVQEKDAGFIFLSFKDLEKRHEFEERQKIILALKILKHREIINQYRVFTKFGNEGDMIRIDVNETNFKKLLTNKKKFGRKRYSQLQTEKIQAEKEQKDD